MQLVGPYIFCDASLPPYSSAVIVSGVFRRFCWCFQHHPAPFGLESSTLSPPTLGGPSLVSLKLCKCLGRSTVLTFTEYRGEMWQVQYDTRSYSRYSPKTHVDSKWGQFDSNSTTTWWRMPSVVSLSLLNLKFFRPFVDQSGSSSKSECLNMSALYHGKCFFNLSGCVLPHSKTSFIFTGSRSSKLPTRTRRVRRPWWAMRSPSWSSSKPQPQ